MVYCRSRPSVPTVAWPPVYVDEQRPEQGQEAGAVPPLPSQCLSIDCWLTQLVFAGKPKEQNAKNSVRDSNDLFDITLMVTIEIQ